MAAPITHGVVMDNPNHDSEVLDSAQIEIYDTYQ